MRFFGKAFLALMIGGVLAASAGCAASQSAGAGLPGGAVPSGSFGRGAETAFASAVALPEPIAATPPQADLLIEPAQADAVAEPPTIEQQALAEMGIMFPFDYRLRQDAIDAGMAVVSGDERLDNRKVLLQFLDQYQNGDDCGLVVVWYAGEELLDVYALLRRNGVLMCEVLADGARELLLLKGLVVEQGIVYGLTDGGERLVLAVNVGPEPEPVDLSEEINRLAGALDAELHWFSVQPVPELNGESRVAIRSGLVNALLEMLAAEPIYLLEDVKEQHEAAQNLDIRFTIEQAGDRMILIPRTDGSIVIGDGVALYVTQNRTLYQILLGMAGLEEFHLEDIGSVRSITLSYRDAAGVDREISVEDKDAINRIVQALGEAKIGQPRIWFEPDVQMVLSAGGGEVVCSLIGSARPEDPENEILINGFFWFESAEVVRLVRELLS